MKNNYWQRYCQKGIPRQTKTIMVRGGKGRHAPESSRSPSVEVNVSLRQIANCQKHNDPGYLKLRRYVR